MSFIQFTRNQDKKQDVKSLYFMFGDGWIKKFGDCRTLPPRSTLNTGFYYASASSDLVERVLIKSMEYLDKGQSYDGIDA